MKNYSKLFRTLVAILLLSPLSLLAQGSMSNKYITVNFVPDSDDWTYNIGDDVVIDLSVVKNNKPIKNVEIKYEWGYEKLTPLKVETINTGNSGVCKLKLKGATKPGFMSCVAAVKVEGQKYTNYINLGFDPHQIETQTKLPKDFMEYWQANLESARKVPLAPMITLKPELCTSDANVYHIRFQNIARNSYIYGMLSVPTTHTEGEKHPAILFVPGAGVRPYSGEKATLPAKGVVTLQVGIHGIPVDQPQQIYDDLRSSALSAYNTYGIDDKDTYYYKRVYLGCVKAIDFLSSLSYVDDTNIAVMGGSQGGALSIIVGALEPKVKCISARYPALCEIAGYYNGSTGGWPNFMMKKGDPNVEAKLETISYYDVVNFARFLQVPGFYVWGYNDRTCPPTSLYSAYNAIEADKNLQVFQETAHWHYPEELARCVNFVLNKLQKQ